MTSTKQASAGPSRRPRHAGALHPEIPKAAEKTKAIPLPDVVGQSTLAKLFGISERAVRDLAKDGTIQRTGRGAYILTASVQAYCARLRDTAAGRGGESSTNTLTAERARLAREQAEGQAMKNAALRRDLVPAADVQREWTDILRTVRAGLMAVPNRVQQNLSHLSAHDVAVIDREVRAALVEVAGGNA